MSANEFAVSLRDMYQAGNRYLPAIANRFLEGNQAIERASDDRSAFEHTTKTSPTASVTVFTTAVSPVFSHWDGLRDALQQALAESAEHTFDLAEALLRVTDYYAHTDAESERAFKTMITNDDPSVHTDPYDFAHRRHAAGRH